MVRHHRINRFIPLLFLLAAFAVIVLAAPEAVEARESVIRFGGGVVIRADERVNGDVVAFGGSIEMLGEVRGDVVAVGGSVTVDGIVSGDVIAVGGSVALGPNAQVGGDLTVVGGSVSRDPQAVVRGETSRVSFADGIRLGFGDFTFYNWRWFGFPFSLFTVVGLFALALVVLAVIPEKVHAIEQYMESNAGRSIMIGLLAVVLVVPLTVVLVLTIIGPVVLWLGFLAAKLVGYVALVSLVGRKVSERFSIDGASIWGVVIGVVIVAALRYTPVIGGLFSVAATLWSVGAVIDTKFGTNRPWLPPRNA